MSINMYLVSAILILLVVAVIYLRGRRLTAASGRPGVPARPYVQVGAGA
jgi:hypothetical protein